MNWLTDDQETETLGDIACGVNPFPRRPRTVSTNFNCGKIGGASLFNNQTTAGVMLRPVEAFAGDDCFQDGSINFHDPKAGGLPLLSLPRGLSKTGFFAASRRACQRSSSFSA